MNLKNFIKLEVGDKVEIIDSVSCEGNCQDCFQNSCGIIVECRDENKYRVKELDNPEYCILPSYCLKKVN